MGQLKGRAVIFDLDGVLVDSAACIERQLQRWASRQRLDVEQVLALAHGRRTLELVRLAAPHLDAEREAAQIQRDEACDTDGVVEQAGAAQRLRSLPLPNWGIATSGTREVAVNRINQAGLPMPEVLITADDVTQGKPHPEPYLAAAYQLGVMPNQCIVIEDAPVGIQAARSAEMSVIAVATTHSQEELSEADLVVNSLVHLQMFKADSSSPSNDFIMITAFK